MTKNLLRPLRKFRKKVVEKEEPGAVVVGFWPAGLGIVRSLGRKGITVLGVDSDLNQPGAFTRFCETVHCSDISSHVLIDSLIAVAKGLDVKPVLFLSSDLAVMCISEYREELKKHFRFLLPERDTINTLLNKRDFSLYALRNNLPVPKTVFIGNDQKIKEIADNIEFPCIIKPAFRNELWEKMDIQKTFKIASQDELIGVYKAISTVQKDVIIQEWIPGKDSEIYFCLLYFDESSKPVAHFEGRKILQWPPECGSTAIAEDTECQPVLDESIKLFKLLRYKGIGSVEFKRDPRNGRFMIMEPTVGRTNLQSDIATVCGVDIPYIAYCDILGINTRGKYAKKVRSTKWIHEYNVLQRMRCKNNAYKLKFTELLKILKGNCSYAFFAWDDPFPFVKLLTAILIRKVNQWICLDKKGESRV